MNLQLVQDDEEQPATKKAELIRTLRELLRDTFRLRNEGVIHSRLAHSQGYADGYMRLLVVGGYVTEHELLDIVAEVRRGLFGPATGTLPSSRTNH